MNKICPSCSSDSLIFIGEIQKRNIFAGKPLPDHLFSDKLLKCRECNLHFRWPRPDKLQSLELYRRESAENWQYELKNRKDWQIAIDWLNKHKTGGSVLDVGCFDGQFFEGLRGDRDFYGIEINSNAAEQASQKGIKIIGSDIYQMKSLTIKFDVITAFDVIEHMAYPFNFIEDIAHLIKEDGLIIISSGNTGALTWKMSSNMYWYCSIAEHISFICMKWIHFAAHKCGLEILFSKEFSHLGKKNLAKFIKESIKNIVYISAPALYAMLKKIKNRNFHNADLEYDNPPSWISSKDHLVVILKKKTMK